MKTIFHLMPVVAVCVSTLGACGGGGSGGVATAPANTTSIAGTISGLGSIVVNGVRYETIGASVVDLDDRHAISNPLAMGMTVKIEPLSGSAATAGTIHIQSGIKGSTSTVDAVSKTLNVAGLPVTTDSATFIVTPAGLAGNFSDLANNLNVEVYGLPQSNGSFKATRIEIKTIAQSVQLVGTVANLNVTNNTFTLGSGSNSVTIAYAGLTAPSGLANGSVVSVHTTSNASAPQYTASSLHLRSPDAATYTNYVTSYGGTSGIKNETNELYGMVSGLTSTGSGCSMQVQGVPTTLGSTALCASIQNGDYVEVKGLLVNGALNAYRVEFKTAGGDRLLNGYHDDANDNDHDGLKYSRQLTSTSSDSAYASNSASSYEIYGTLSNCTGNTCTLTTNGTAVTADLSTAVWEHGQVTSGLVEAKGYMASANTFKVSKIEPKR